MMLRWSLILGGILIAGGPVIACKSFDETSASMPASLQMLQMAATEMDEGSPIPSMYRSPLLIAVGRTDEAIRDMLKIEDEFFRELQAAVIVDQIVRFDAKFSLDDPRLKANLSPESFAFSRADGLLRRGELNAAESELTRIPAENFYAPSFLDLYQRIAERRLAIGQKDAALQTLRTAVLRALSSLTGRNSLYGRSQELEKCATIANRHQLSDLNPGLIEKIRQESESLKNSSSTDPSFRALIAVNLASAFLSCGQRELADEQLSIAVKYVDLSLEELDKPMSVAVKQVDRSFGEIGETMFPRTSKRELTVRDALETTARIAALQATTGKDDEARQRLDDMRQRAAVIVPKMATNDGLSLFQELVRYGAFDLAEEFIDAADSNYWRCEFNVKLAQELSRRGRQDDAKARILKVIPLIRQEATKINRFN